MLTAVIFVIESLFSLFPVMPNVLNIIIIVESVKEKSHLLDMVLVGKGGVCRGHHSRLCFLKKSKLCSLFIIIQYCLFSFTDISLSYFKGLCQCLSDDIRKIFFFLSRLQQLNNNKRTSWIHKAKNFIISFYIFSYRNLFKTPFFNGVLFL